MLTDQDLRELLDYQAQFPVISLYLNTDLTEASVDTCKRNLRGLLKELELKEDAEIIERFVDYQYDWSGRGLAVFSCSPENWFRFYTLAVPLRSRVRVSNRPHVKPLVDLLDSYGGYGVALVDKQGARFFYFHLGELREQEGIFGESIRRTKRGGGSQAAGRRGGVAGQTDYVAEVAERNIKESAEAATRFFSDNNIRRVLIGGTDDTVAQFRNQLPKSWQSLIVGSFPMSKAASSNEILERAMQIGRDAEQIRASRLVDAAITGAAKGRGGVVGIDETLQAVHEGRVQILLIREGLRAPGQQCTQCGFIITHKIESCPFCGGKSQEIPDAVDLAVRKVLLTGGEVEVLHADMGLEKFDDIGGLVRF